MDQFFGNGITVTSGFDLGAKSPLDTRTIVNTIEERDAHVTGNRAYEGMKVYVISEKKEYRWTGTEWTDSTGGGGDGLYSKVDGENLVLLTKRPDGHGGSVIIDPTLKMSEQAADAKVTGDRISALESGKFNKSGHTPNKFLGTDQSGNVVMKEAPQSGGSLDDINSAISTHNVSKEAHNDIRLSLKGLSDKINAFFDVEDTTMDQLSELIEYIKKNEGLITSVTNAKVSKEDIVDNLTTNVSNKPLSAAQGVALKAITDTLNSTLNNKLNKSGFTPNKFLGTDGSGNIIVKDPPEGGGSTTIDNVDAENVYFSKDLITTFPIGKVTLTNGQATIKANGKNLKQVWDSIFITEQNPHTTQPSTSITLNQSGRYEVGSTVTPSYSTGFNAGSYSYGPATNVSVTKWEIEDTLGVIKNTSTGSFAQLTVIDTTDYKIIARATHSEGSVPLTNTGNPYPTGKIAVGTKTATSSSITGYRNTFYGTMSSKTTLDSPTIRNLTKSNRGLSNGSSFTIPVSIGTLRVIIAYPATLRNLTSVLDKNDSNSNIVSGFGTPQTIKVEGINKYKPIDYKVYKMDFANPYNTSNTFTVTI